MKKMVWNFPLASLSVIMNAQKVKIGYWNIFGSRFEKDLPIYEGSMGGLAYANHKEPELQKLYQDMKMRKVIWMQAEGDVVVIGVDRYDCN